MSNVIDKSAMFTRISRAVETQRFLDEIQEIFNNRHLNNFIQDNEKFKADIADMQQRSKDNEE